MSNSKNKLSDFCNFSEDEEWVDEKKDVIVVVDDNENDDDDEKAHPTTQPLTRPRRSTARPVHYGDVDYGMVNEYSQYT